MDAIVAKNVVKTYRLGVGRARVREMLPWPIDRGLSRMWPNWWRRNTFNALDDVSMSVSMGEAVGLMGHNGAGKTTMLKVIAGVTAPTEGSVTSGGRLGALIDVLVGFHPELTGRENAYLLGAIYGFGRREMRSRVDRIFEFTELENDLIDTPVKRYSSGMLARLGFAVTAHLDLEVLLVDEVLAVGDAMFQQKCINWMDDFRDNGGTLLFVSHNLSLVRNMTERVVWLDHGRVIDDGSTEDVLVRYARALERRDFGRPALAVWQTRKAMRARGQYRWGAGGARVEEVHVDEEVGMGKALQVAISYEAPSLEQAVFCVGFVDEGNRIVGAASSPTVCLDGKRGQVRCQIDPLPLRSGIYFPVVAILSQDGRVRDRWRLDRAIVVERNGEAVFGDDFGPVAISGNWVA